MKNLTPKFLMVYKCGLCGHESGYTEPDTTITCHNCKSLDRMKLISKQVLTPEAMELRLKTITDRMFNNIKSAYESISDEDRENFTDDNIDLEKEMLLLLNKAKEFKEKINELDLKGGKN